MTQERLYKYLRGETTAHERDEILSWINASPENMQTYRTLRNVYDTVLCSEQEIDLRRSVVNGHKRSRALRRQIPAIAASLMCVVLLAGSLLWKPEPVMVTRNSIDVINTPAGQRSELTLADGTHVWLGSNSTLRLSPDGEARRVSLQGEAFFSVAKNEAEPFVVSTAGRSITVYGTQFNVNAYPTSKEMEVQLYNGSVSVTDSTFSRTVALTPGKQLTINATSIEIADFDPLDGSPLWIKGIHAFQNSTYTEILNTMSNVFDVKLTIKGRWTNAQRCTGKFHEADGPESLLEALQTIREFSYEWDPESRQLVIE